MLKKEIIYRELLIQWLKNKKGLLTQKSLSETCNVSISTVHHALSSLEDLNAIKKKNFGFKVTDAKKVLIHWANQRKLKRDVIYSTHSKKGIKEIEKEMPPSAIFTAYSAYKLKYGDVPADYGEVYIYGNRKEIEDRFEKKAGRKNIFVLKLDENLEKHSKKGIVPDVQSYVDLWNIGTWNANEFLKNLEAKIFEN